MFTIDWVNKGMKFVKSAFDRKVKLGTQDVLKEIVKDFENSTSNWSDRPEFWIEDDEIYYNDKRFLWINFGTSWRAKKMSPDWVSKSQVGILGTRPGAGTVAGWANKPGIEARRWDIASVEHQSARGIIPNAIIDRLEEGIGIFRQEYILKTVEWEDGRGNRYKSLLRDIDSDNNADRGILIGPPPVTELDWTGIQSDLNRELFNLGLFTWQDVQDGGDKLKSAIFGAMKSRLINLYRNRRTHE